MVIWYWIFDFEIKEFNNDNFVIEVELIVDDNDFDDKLEDNIESLIVEEGVFGANKVVDLSESEVVNFVYVVFIFCSVIIIKEVFEIIEFEIYVDIGFDNFVEVKEEDWISDDDDNNGCVVMVVVWIFEVGCVFEVVLLIFETNVDFKVGIVLSFWILETNVDFKVRVVLFIWVLETNVVSIVGIVVFVFEIDMDSDLVSPGISYFTIFSSDILTKSKVGTLSISQVLTTK